MAIPDFGQAPIQSPADIKINPNLTEIGSISYLLGDDSEQQFEEAVALIEATIAELTAEQPPVLSVEGISLGSSVSASTTVAQSEATQVSLITQSAADVAAIFAERAINGPMPEILMLTRMPNISKDVAIKNCQLSQAERKIVQEVLEAGLTAVSETDAADAYANLFEENALAMEEVSATIGALSDVLSNAEIASTAFNIRDIQDQIMLSAASKLQSIVQTSEGGNDVLSSTIEQHIQEFFPNNDPEDVSSSNTTIILTLLLDTLRACESAIPASIPGVGVYKDGFDTVSKGELKFAEVSYPPVCTPQSIKQTIPRTRDLCRPNLSSQLSIFQADSDREGGENANLKQNRPSVTIKKSNLDQTWAEQKTEIRVYNKNKHTAVLAAISKVIGISNELITSAGIGRLSGSPLGNRFLLEHTPEEGLVQTKPYDKVLGEDPFSSKSKLESFHQTSPTHKGGMTDLLALGEELAPSAVKILPFEVRSVQDTMTKGYYLSGKKYFIESGLSSGPWQQMSKDDPENLGVLSRKGLINYANSFSQFTNDLSSYMNDLLCLDTSTNLTPELILARILKDISVVLASINNTSEFRDPKSDAVAGIFAMCNNSRNGAKSWALPGSTTRKITLTDYLTGLTIATLNDYDQLLEDTSFKLNSDRTKITFTKLQDGEEVFDTLSTGHFLNKTTIALTDANNLEGDPDICVSPIAKNLLTKVEGQISCDMAGGLTILKLDKDLPVNFSMHDNTFSGGYNLLNLIAVTIRELQSEALMLAKRADADSDYRSSTAKTNYSGMDDDRFIRLIVEIYTDIASLVLPISSVARNPDGNDTSGGERIPGTIYSLVSRSSASASQSVVDTIVGSLINGDRITADSVSAISGVNKTTKINSTKIPIEKTDQNGNVAVENSFPIINHEGSNNAGKFSYSDQRVEVGLSEVSLIAEGCQKHRYGIKSSLKIIESVSESVLAGASQISTTFSILNQDNVDEANLSESEAVLFNLVNNYENDPDLSFSSLTPLTPEQLNLKKVDYLNYLRQDSEDDFEMRSFISPSKQERDATLDYIDQLWSTYATDAGLQDFYILSVGIPQGLIESLRHPFVNTGAKGPNKIGSDLTINVSRHDQLYGTIPSVGNTVYELDPIPIDPEIFIIPGSIKYDRLSEVTGVNAIEKIHKQTTYYRIRSGKIIEEIEGSDQNVSDQKLANCLKSYLLDLAMYELQRFRMYELIDRNGDRISSSAKEFLDVISSSEEMSKAILCKQGFSNLFKHHKNSSKIKSGGDLSQILRVDPITLEQKFSSNDVLVANYLTCFSKLSVPKNCLFVRPYDRVYQIPYNEASIRQRLWDQNYFNDQVTRAESREDFDMFSLSVIIQSNTGTGG